MSSRERWAYVALGANLGDPEAQIVRAAEELGELGEVLGKSSLYLTAPVGGPQDQPPYLNAVMLIETEYLYSDPRELLAKLLSIEHLLGRQRRVRWGPRTIDLDLLDYSGLVLQATAGTHAGGRLLPPLTLPHPGIDQRGFVLAPLCELAPDWRHPTLDQGACQLLTAVGTGGMRRLTTTW